MVWLTQKAPRAKKDVLTIELTTGFRMTWDVGLVCLKCKHGTLAHVIVVLIALSVKHRFRFQYF